MSEELSAAVVAENGVSEVSEEPKNMSIPDIIRYHVKSVNLDDVNNYNDSNNISINIDESHKGQILGFSDKAIINSFFSRVVHDGAANISSIHFHSIYRNVVDKIMKDIFGDMSEEEFTSLFQNITNNFHSKEYDEEFNVIIGLNENRDIFGMSLNSVSPSRKERKLLNDIALIAYKKGFKVVSLLDQRIHQNDRSNILNITKTPEFNTKITEPVVVFGEHYSVRIPSVPLHPGRKNIQDYIKDGVNPYSKWDDIYKDNRSNVVYAMSNKNEILILLATKAYNAIHMLASDLKCSPEEREFHTEQVYHENKVKMMEMFVDKTQKELSTSYNTMKDETDNLQARMTDLQKEMERVGLELKDKMRTLKYFNIDKLKEDAKKMAEKQFERVYKIPQVSLVLYNDDTSQIEMYTNNMYTYRRDQKTYHDMGTFKVTISWSSENFMEDTIKVYSTKWENKSAEFLTSHVYSNNNYMCMGNSRPTLAKNFANRDVFGIVYNIIDFLKSENLGDPASVSKSFPVVPKEVATSEYNNYKKENKYTKVLDDFDIEALTV